MTTSFDVYQATRMQAIQDKALVNAEIDGSGHLQLTARDGSQVDAGDATGLLGDQGPLGPVAPAASTTVEGITRLSTKSDALAGTDAASALTPAALRTAIEATRAGYGAVYLKTTTAVAASARIPFDTLVDWGGEGVSGMAWDATNHVFTVTNAGIYYVEGEIAQTTAVAGYFYLQTGPLASMGNTLLGSNTVAIAGTHSYAHGLVKLNAGDSVGMIMGQAMTLNGAQNVCHMTVKLLRPI